MRLTRLSDIFINVVGFLFMNRIIENDRVFG